MVNLQDGTAYLYALPKLEKAEPLSFSLTVEQLKEAANLRHSGSCKF